MSLYDLAPPDLEIFHAVDYNQGDLDLVDGWYWWHCFSGCLPEGEPVGPFETERAALEDAETPLDY